ncbi:acyltransferase [Bradyrhizobium sp. AC87j1]|uniref:acyltransferase family protein n=1 Tax=Bradyrhizobium sp. AC87j1 TaxID=2055894 RepID=UPI00137533B6|nr:acyltransferase [Bradyrhizobium sp. AC87j1]
MPVVGLSSHQPTGAGLMGTVRFLLAAIVVGFHCQFGVIHQTIGGLAAVEVFYIISGFYMAAAYKRHYPGRPAAFFASRFARLYPFYLAVLAATFALHLWNPANESGIFNSLRTDERPYVINLSLLGLDLYSAMHSTTYLLVPQAWSISAEIVFYALLPALLLLNRKWLAGLVVAAFAIKMTILHVYEWKWAYFPFYSQIGYFGTGVVLFSLRDRLTWSTRTGYWLAVLYCLYLLGDVYADVDYHGGIVQGVPLVVATCIVIPTLFSRINGPLSTALGDASYGVYLSHFLFIQIAINLQFFDPITLTNPHIVSHGRILFQTLGILLASTVIALAFEFTVQRWIDRARRSLFYNRKGPHDSFGKA